MGDKIFIGNFAKGLTINRLPFVIDNDAFPTMYNFYSWRGRAKRKRGTILVGQLQIQSQSVLNSTPPANWQIGQIGTTSGGGAFTGNLIASAITGITKASSAVVTVTNVVFMMGQVVTFTGVVGMTQINGLSGTITAVNYAGSTITVNINSSAFTAYGSVGIATLVNFNTTTPSQNALVGIVPGSITLSDGTNTYTEPTIPNGTLIGSPAGTGTINYATGAITITGGAHGAVLVGKFSYYPGSPVLGLKEFVLFNPTLTPTYPVLLAFDQSKAYQITTTNSTFYNVSYYKGTDTPVYWTGQDYQQFNTTNYAGAFWATNGKPGFNFVNGTYSSGSTTASITFNFSTGAGNFTSLIVGDKLWFNEWTSGGSNISGVTGTVSSISGAASGNYVVTFSANVTVAGTGIVQLLTASIPGQDGIKFYDGDMTGASGLPTSTSTGWVNFAPPLSSTAVSIDLLPSAQYYLVGAIAIVPFKDRLLFFGAYVQSSTTGPFLLQDTVIWSWNGTPYYTVNSSGAPVLVPLDQTANVQSFYTNVTGYGGYLSAGIDRPITYVNNNEDVLIVGFTTRQTRFAYTGNDLQPFLFYNINQELGTFSTFSAITLDRGVLSIGANGILITSQESAERIDLVIPDSVFQIQGSNNGVQRVNAVRDFFKEWVYFSYPLDDSEWKFPTNSFLLNYRDNTWSVLYENFTAHGPYRKSSGFTWATCPFPTWSEWTESWNSGSATAFFPNVVGGTPEGYVLIKGEGTGEAVSCSINAIASSGGLTQITAPNHCVAPGDYLYFQGALGTTTAIITAITNATQGVVTATNTFAAGQIVLITGVVGMTEINGRYVSVVSATGASFVIALDTTSFTAYGSGGLATISPLAQQIGQVQTTPDANTFTVDIPYVNQGYVGLGQFAKLSQPLLQTKQFGPYWQEGRQVRLGVQKYLMDFTANAQVTVNIYLSQDPDEVYNNNVTEPNGTLIYSQTMYTCPESANIGLSPANTNLQMPTAAGQYQIWHRINTSLQGDSVQIGITLSDAQMRNLTYATSEITLHAAQIDIDRGPLLS